jgi:hypothetical protein
MGRDHKEDLERIEEICENFDTISIKDADFVNDISHKQGVFECSPRTMF